MLDVVTIQPRGRAVDRAFGRLVELAQGAVVQLLDRLRHPDRDPPTASLLAKLRDLEVPPELLTWGPMTLLPYRAEYIVDEIQRQPPKCVLEVGAGASSLVFAALAKRYGFKLVSIENFKGSIEYVRYLLERSGIDAPLAMQKCGFKRGRFPDGTGYWWFDADLGRAGSKYDFVFVDGPMSTLVGRAGALPEVFPFLAPDARIYFDDTHLPHGQACVAAWLRNYPGLVVANECQGISKFSFTGAR